MPRSSARKKARLFHAVVHVTREEHWTVEADSEEDARAQLAAFDGHCCQNGEVLHAEIEEFEAT